MDKNPATRCFESNCESADAPAIAESNTMGTPIQRRNAFQLCDAVKWPFEEYKRASSVRLASRITSVPLGQITCGLPPASPYWAPSLSKSSCLMK
jgi:hypothetical protein